MAVKRKRSEYEAEAKNHDESDSGASLSQKMAESDSDIADALIGVDDEDDGDLIRKTLAKKNMKQGTQMINKSKQKQKGDVGGGSFQSMGLNPSLLKALTVRGYRVPTPIQRLSIPVLLTSPPRDLVGMARTGSGKTLAYMVPLIHRLNGRHSTVFGARALILVPTRELAVQVLKVGKDLARGVANGPGTVNSGTGDHAGDNVDVIDTATTKGGLALRWGLIVGGEGLDEQFDMITSNPDVIIATPGRLLHLIVEMNLDLKSVQYVVFDEADRLFELGFETALQEILHRLPTDRQTLLFSATLPKSLVDFAKAGLKTPKLVRLDSESKISADLRMAFFSVKEADKDAALLVLLRDVIGVPSGNQFQLQDTSSSHQTVIFTATKHHVEYLKELLTASDYQVAHIYGTLDQAARSIEMDRFRKGRANILVVTDVAARGIDIPVLENVINYDFPPGARVFVHRVGRTARAGQKGWAWSLVSPTEVPYLLDLQLFLGRPLKSKLTSVDNEAAYAENMLFGPFPRDALEQEVDYLRTVEDRNYSITTLRDLMRKGHSMYERSKGKASQASYKRAKEMSKEEKWGLGSVVRDASTHPVLLWKLRGHKVASSSRHSSGGTTKDSMLKAIESFRPHETVFEIGTRGKTTGAMLMKERKKALAKARSRAGPSSSGGNASDEESQDDDADMADQAELEITFGSQGGGKPFQDQEYFMSHYQKDANTEKGYSLRDGATFAEQAERAAFDLTGDEGLASQKRRSQLKWDRKRKKFVKGDGTGADNVKLVKTESGAKLPISYRSGKFDEWKSKTKGRVPKVGEMEDPSAGRRNGGRSSRFRHSKVVAPKPMDKLRTDYERKVRQQKKHAESRGGEASPGSEKGGGKAQRGRNSGRWKGKSPQKVKNELKTVDQIRKQRQSLANRKAKNARPSKKGKR